MQVVVPWFRSIALAIALVAGIPHAAHALTLADLDAGASFGVGSITFSDFEISVAGDLSVDLADYPVQLLGDGFRIAGPLTMLLGDEGTLLVSYVAETAAGVFLDGAALFSPLVAVGSGAAALVSESLLGPGGVPVGTLLALNVDGGDPPVFSDSVGFAAVSRLEVVKVVGLQSGTVAIAPHVDQRFSVVPEPLTLAMVGSGLVGLALSGRRRAVVA